MTPTQLNQADQFAATNGIELQPDGNTATMVVESCHLNGANVCQGGALFTLADLSAAGLTQGEQLTTDSTIHFLAPAQLGDRLTAHSEYIREGRLSLIQTEIRNQDKKLIAQITSRFYSTKKK